MYRNLWNLSKYWTNIFRKYSIKSFWNCPQDIEACGKLKSDDNDWNNKVIMKFCKSNDMVWVINKKISLRLITKMVEVSLTPGTSFSTNRSACSCYMYLWSKSKSLWSSKLISSLWVSNDSQQINLGNDTAISVTHKDDLKAHFSCNSVLIDAE